MSLPFDVTLVTCRPLPEPDPDEAPLLSALTQAGLEVRLCAWDDESVEWSTSAVTVIRSTWDYHRRRDAFIDWAREVDGVSLLLNPPTVVEWNSHKSYLLTLPLRGVPVVPTVLVEQGTTISLEQISRAEEWPRLVIKPAVSAGSYETHAMEEENLDESTFRRLVDAEDVLVQPYIESVDHHGERSLIFIDGECTHCIRKHPRFAEDDERVTGPHEPTADELTVARSALQAVSKNLLYARVDLVENADEQPVVAELELIEPSLFFRFSDTALQRFTESIIRRVTEQATRH